MTMISGKEKLEAAKDYLLDVDNGDNIFYGTECLGKKWVEDTQIPTLCTDGKGVVRYNPDYIESISFENTVYCVVHENDHDMLLHPLRALELDMDMAVANIAADIVVNLREIAAGFKPPPGVIHRPEFEGWSFEGVYDEIYPQMMQDRKKQGKPGDHQQDDGSGDPGRCGGFTRPKDGSGQDMGKAELAELEKEIVARVTSNAQAVRVAGFLPGWLREVIKEVRNPKVPWTSLLERFITENCRSDYSWAEMDEEYAQRGLFVPSLSSKVIGELIFVRDASGSIPDSVYNQFTAEAQDALDRLQPEILRVINFADSVEADCEYRPGDRVEVGERSSGGTLFQPIFDYIKDKGYQPACVAILTDMVSGDAPKDPGYPVIWIDCGDEEAIPPAFGELVRVRR